MLLFFFFILKRAAAVVSTDFFFPRPEKKNYGVSSFSFYDLVSRVVVNDSIVPD